MALHALIISNLFTKTTTTILEHPQLIGFGSFQLIFISENKIRIEGALFSDFRSH